MLLPPILVVGLDEETARPLMQLLTRIGLANPGLVQALTEDAARYLTGCATSRLPVVVLACASPGADRGLSIVGWMREQPDAIASIEAIALVREGDEVSLLEAAELGVAAVPMPVEMRPLIAALKSLALPEKARIDPATLTVQVELWPRTASVSRQ
jgi:CheY-like chemotaxis protein